MLPCKKCVYKENIPGDCHISCLFDWEKNWEKEDPKNRNGEESTTNKWFVFPFNYDPVWGPNKCDGYNTELNPEDKKEFDPMEKLIKMLGKRSLF
jgi:hypothetical protein